MVSRIIVALFVGMLSFDMFDVPGRPEVVILQACDELSDCVAIELPRNRLEDPALIEEVNAILKEKYKL